VVSRICLTTHASCGIAAATAHQDTNEIRPRYERGTLNIPKEGPYQCSRYAGSTRPVILFARSPLIGLYPFTTATHSLSAPDPFGPSTSGCPARTNHALSRRPHSALTRFFRRIQTVLLANLRWSKPLQNRTTTHTLLPL